MSRSRSFVVRHEVERFAVAVKSDTGKSRG